jgi:hypothetical protein
VRSELREETFLKTALISGVGAPILLRSESMAADSFGFPMGLQLYRGKIRAAFIEQEPPFKEMAALEAIKLDFEYLHSLKV